MSARIQWNPHVQLIFSDVDETLAELYLPAADDLTAALTRLLRDGVVLCCISGQSVWSIIARIVTGIPVDLRRQIFIGHCSGAEVFAFQRNGELLLPPLYSLYEKSLSLKEREEWRRIVRKLMKEFHLQVLPTMPIKQFMQVAMGNSRAVMLEDRGPQITVEFPLNHGFQAESPSVFPRQSVPDDNLDLRLPFIQRANHLLHQACLPIQAHLAGVFAVDFTLHGVSKTTVVSSILENKILISEIAGQQLHALTANAIEVWGDKFSLLRGGTDAFMSQGLPKEVRSISFRAEDPQEFPSGYNIVVWDGEQKLQAGVLEYLSSRKGRIRG